MTGKTQNPAQLPGGTKVRWDDSKMRSTYANVCNAASSREEITLLFGTNQTWHSGGKEFVVELSDRIILNPYAAKRLAGLLNAVLKQYEQNFGAIDIEVPRGGSGPVGQG